MYHLKLVIVSIFALFSTVSANRMGLLECWANLNDN